MSPGGAGSSGAGSKSPSQCFCSPPNRRDPEPGDQLSPGPRPPGPGPRQQVEEPCPSLLAACRSLVTASLLLTLQNVAGAGAVGRLTATLSQLRLTLREVTVVWRIRCVTASIWFVM